MTISTWCYNHCSQESWSFSALGFMPVTSGDFEEEGMFTVTANEEGSGEEDNEGNNIGVIGDSGNSQLLTPIATKIVGCAILLAFATMDVSLKTG